MSLKGVFEIILHLNQFTNIQLPHQGLAAISASIYKLQKGKQVVVAVPYEFPYQRTYKMTKNKIKQDSIVEDMFFRSKVGFIKYSDQKIFLDDFVQFRLQLQAFPQLDTQNVFLQLNLIFTSRYYASKDQAFEGTPVSKIKIKLKEIQNGIINYSQVDFKGEYPSKISFVLFCHLMHYKFEKYHLKKQPTSKQISRSKLQNLQELIVWSKENILQKNQNPIPIFYASYVKNLRHSNYLIQSKLNQCLTVKRKTVLKVPKSYLQSIGHKNQIDQKTFRQYLQSYKPNNAALNLISQEIHQIRIQNFQFLQEVINEFYHDQLNIQKMLNQFNGYIKQKFGERVFRNIIYQGDKIQNALKNNKKIAKQMRSKQISLSDYPLQSQIFINNKDDDQFIFYQITLPKQYKNKQKIKQPKKVFKKTEPTNQSNLNQSEHQESSSQNTEKSENYEHQTSNFFSENKVQFDDIKYNERNMLIVMCHGFQGSSYDMSLIQRGLKAVLPNAAYLISRKNQDDTQGDIEHMGEKLADQIKYYIRAFMDQNHVVINFVGHSMGGIIARASFKHLRNFRDQFGFYCTLSTPHLGYLNGVDGKIKAGLWVLRKWKPIRSLDQLSMEEAKHPRDSYLYRLSKEGSLKYFRKIILFSSFQDSYVAWHSARISLHESKNSQAKVQNQMVQNILGYTNGTNQETTIHRLDINFNVKGNSIDSLIGRAAHINLIVQDSLFDVVNITLPRLFDLREYQTGIVQ